MRRNQTMAAAVVALAGAAAWAQAVETAAVVARPVERTVELPSEILPYLSVEVHAKVPGYVETMKVDRGSVVKKGEVLAELSAPEMQARAAGARSQASAAAAEKAQAAAQLAAAQSTWDRTRRAAQTPGAIAGNELILAQKQMEAAQALVKARDEASRAAEQAARALEELEGYLKLTAPFDGVVTERMAHPGALVGPGNDVPLVRLEQVARLRVVVPVPEEDVSGIAPGAPVTFTVPAWPERSYSGTVARISRSLDRKTRTMAVELDVRNGDGSLAPGMFPSVAWPVRRQAAALLVPKTAVVTTTERTFVVRERDGRAEWVDVRKGATVGDLVVVIGRLKAGDRVARRATDELRDGAVLGK